MRVSLTLSVVIPTFNRASFLRRAIESARSQLREGDEIIVVDDGSTDETPSLLEEYREEIRVLRGDRGGAGVARNRGIRAAAGDLVAFLDSDDEWFPHKTELQRTLFERHPHLLYSFGEMACTFLDGSVARRHLWTWHRDPRSWEEILPSVPYSELAPLPEGCEDFGVHAGALFRDMAHRLYVLTSSYMVRRREAGDALRFEERVPIYEDWACFGRVARLGDGAFLDRELAWQHGQATERVSDAQDPERASMHLHLLETIWATDPAYLKAHGQEFSTLRQTALRAVAENQITTGQLAEARSTLAQMENPPRSYRILAALPPGIVRGVLAARRRVRALGG